MRAVERPPVELRDEERDARHAAIATSGWGAPFHFLQPRNACFWVYLALVGAGIWTAVTLTAPTARVFAVANITAVLTSSLFAAAFVLFLHRSDRWERTPARLAVAAFLVGGFGAAFAMALPGNAAVMSLYTKAFGQAFAADWQAAFTAPIVEESSKGVAFLLVMGLAPVVVRTLYDGLIVGAYTGLGFQVLEDVLYGQNSAAAHFGADQAQSVLGTFVLRSLTGVASHALYTALFAAGLIYLIGTVAQPRRLGRGTALVLAPVVLHGVWDSLGALTDGTGWAAVLMVGVTVVSLVLVGVTLRLGGARERGFLRAVLQPEVTAGTITAAELDALAGQRRDRHAAVRGRAPGISSR
ncbi:MAG: PrsW family intramembrane metalloprotease, partial [Pseudonocardia sp.]